MNKIVSLACILCESLYCFKMSVVSLIGCVLLSWELGSIFDVVGESILILISNSEGCYGIS